MEGQCFTFFQHVTDLFCTRDNSLLAADISTRDLRRLMQAFHVKLYGLSHLDVMTACMRTKPVTFSLHVPTRILKKEHAKQDNTVWNRLRRWMRNGAGVAAIAYGANNYGGLIQNLIEDPLTIETATPDDVMDQMIRNDTTNTFSNIFMFVLFVSLISGFWYVTSPSSTLPEPPVFRQFKQVLARLLRIPEARLDFAFSSDRNATILKVTYTPQTMQGGEYMKAWKQHITMNGGGTTSRRVFNDTLYACRQCGKKR
jgi:hypothetical protein